MGVVTWVPLDGWSESARGYVLKGRPTAAFAPLARPAGFGALTSGPERGRWSREDSDLLSGPARRRSPLLPLPPSLRPGPRPWPPLSGPALVTAGGSVGTPFSWRVRAGGGGLSLRRELERVTDIWSNSPSSSVRAPSLAPLLPRTMVWGGVVGRADGDEGHRRRIRHTKTSTRQHATTETRQTDGEMPRVKRQLGALRP